MSVVSILERRAARIPDVDRPRDMAWLFHRGGFSFAEIAEAFHPTSEELAEAGWLAELGDVYFGRQTP